MNIESTLKNILHALLNTEELLLDHETPLLGEYPEFDSMGIVTLLLELENAFAIEMNDLDLSADTFATFGSLLQCVESAVLEKEQLLS